MHYDDHLLNLAPVMPAIDVVQQLIEEESRLQQKSIKESGRKKTHQQASDKQTLDNYSASTSGSSIPNVIKPIAQDQKTKETDRTTTTTTSQLERSSSNSDTSKLDELNELIPHNNVRSSGTSISDQTAFPRNQSSLLREDHLEEESYDKVLWNYSSATAGTTLSSTPEMRGTMAVCAAPNSASHQEKPLSSLDNTTECRHHTTTSSKPSARLADSCKHVITQDNNLHTSRIHPHLTRANRKPIDYEIIPKSAILDVYSNDPEVERFLQQLPKIGIEHGYNEQEYKCYSCRRPIGMVFGQSRLCMYDGHLYCTECHLDEKSIIPARILCNWDFKKYPVSKRNQHFLDLIGTEAMFDLKMMSPMLYTVCVEMREILNLRSQAFFLRSYCFTCTQDSISFELTKLVWPREHLIEHIHLYSLEDLEQVKSGALAQLLKSVVSFGRRHVHNCMLCCQKGFICEICKSPQIIYPFDTDSVYRCHKCQTVFHLECFATLTGPECCPRCNRLQGRTKGSHSFIGKK